MNRIDSFKRIKELYLEKDEKGMQTGTLPMRSTDRGFWGTSNMDDVYAFFEKKAFSPDTRFIDLGCGDGRVVLIASLFVRAVGVEWDQELVNTGLEMAKKLDLACLMQQGDMREIDFSAFDMLYMYADQQFNFLEKKLKKELRGSLYLYHDTYHPYFLQKEKITWIDQIPVFRYTNSTIQEE